MSVRAREPALAFRAVRAAKTCANESPPRAFTDWSEFPSPTPGEPTPQELDRAALEACTGGPFNADVDVAEVFTQSDIYDPLEPLRLDSGQPPGRLRVHNTHALEAPWHHDILSACSSWWPLMHPGSVPRTADVTDRDPWYTLDNTPEDRLNRWHTLGFVVQGEPTGNFFKQRCTWRRPEIPRAFDPFWWLPPWGPVSGPSFIDRVRNVLIRGTIAVQRLAGAAKDVPNVAKPTLRQRLLSKRFELEDRVRQLKENRQAFAKQR